MSPPPNWARPSLLPEDSSEPQHTPPEDRALRRAVDAATVDLIRGAASAQVQIAEIGAQMAGLRQETRDGFTELRGAAGRSEAALARLVTLQERANELRAQELDEARLARQAREEAARWWRSLAEPRTVGLILIAVVLWLLGQSALIPTLLPTRAP